MEKRGILVLVKSDDYPIQLVEVKTTEDETQARWDAYCYCSEDSNPQQADVEKYTEAVIPVLLSDTTKCFRD